MKKKVLISIKLEKEIEELNNKRKNVPECKKTTEEIGKTNFFLKDDNSASIFMKNLISPEQYEKIEMFEGNEKITDKTGKLDMVNHSRLYKGLR